MHNWDAIIPKLRAIGFRPDKLIRVSRSGNIPYGISVYSPPLLMDKNVKKIEGCLGKGKYRIVKYENLGEICITEIL